MPEEAAAATETAAENAATENTADTQPKPSETVDFWKQKAREQEKRAKENSDAAKRLSEIEEAGKSEVEKANSGKATAEGERDDARAEALRLRVAVEHGIGLEDADLFLTGRDEESLKAQAKRLTERDGDRKKNGNVVLREGATSTAAASDDHAFVRELFSKQR